MLTEQVLILLRGIKKNIVVDTGDEIKNVSEIKLVDNGYLFELEVKDGKEESKEKNNTAKKTAV